VNGAARHRAVSYRPHPRARPAIAVCLNPLAFPPPADRILVVRLGALGDVARTLPAASLLRAAYPGAHLAWLVEPGAASLLAAQPWIDEVLVFPRPALSRALRACAPAGLLRTLRAFLAGLRARRFELVVDFHSILRSAVLSLASGARQRVGLGSPFGRELAWILATHRARVAPARVSRFERNEALVRFLGVEGSPPLRALDVARDASVAMRERLGPGPPPVAMHPGTSAAASHKRVDPAVFARVAHALSAELGVPTVVTHGPGEEELRLAEAVVREASGAARLAPATTSSSELAALFANVRLAIGSDTGPLHLAALVGTPIVQLLGATDPVENAPWPGTPSRSLHALRPRQEGRRGAGLEHSADAIVAAARELLLADAAPGRAAGSAR
jgi:ADP-heptose:LPS heptosyltransferase